ncbi:hypothetical protein BDV97DRAFT_297078, partial [Delphinella strobiligena]
SCPQVEIPQTPITPVTTDALMSLHNLVKPDAVKNPSKDQNRLLSEVNKEARIRQSTRSVVLGRAKVMSYEDLKAARVKRAANDKK